VDFTKQQIGFCGDTPLRAPLIRLETMRAVYMKWPKQCAILVGGLGTRLGVLTADMPKPLLDCAGRPFLAWVMRELVRFGIEEFVLLAGHKSENIEAFRAAIAAALPKPVNVGVSIEPSPAGTGGAIFHAREKLDDCFLLVNGDSWFDVNLGRFLAEAAAATDVVGHILLRRVEDASRYGMVEIADGRIREFRDRAGGAVSGLSNAGIYVFTRRLFDHLSPQCSLERDILPRLAPQGAISGQIMDGYFIDIGIPADYARAADELPCHLLRPAVLFACGSEPRHSPGETTSGSRRWSPGFRDAVQYVNDHGWHAFVASREHDMPIMTDTERGVGGGGSLECDYLRAVGGVVEDWGCFGDHVHPGHGALDRRNRVLPRNISDMLDDWQVDRAASVLVSDREADLDVARQIGIGALFHAGRKTLGALVAEITAGNLGRCARR
jgi:D-glycero-D-manno-heptose 1,7-bisphosphate phosphatase